MDLKKVLAEIEMRKNKIAENRDRLRDIMDDLSECLDSFDDGIEGLENGRLEIESAIDTLSQTI